MNAQQIATTALHAPLTAAVETINQSIHPNDIVVEMYYVAPQEMCDNLLKRCMDAFEKYHSRLITLATP